MGPISTIGREAKDLLSDGRGLTLLAIAGGWSLSIGVRMIYPALLPHIRSTHELSLTMAGVLLTLLWLAYALGQLPGGLLSDRLGEGSVLIVSTVTSAGTLVLVVTMGSTSLLFAATALFGFGTALYGVARFTVLAELYPDRVGAVTGVTMAAGDVGNSLLPPVAGVVATAGAWQYGFAFAIPCFLLVAVGLWTSLPGHVSAGTSERDGPALGGAQDILSAVRRPAILRTTAILVVGNGVWQAFTGFYPTYLIEAKELSPTLAAGLFGLFFALGSVIKPLAGGAYDRIGIRRSLGFVLGTAGIGFSILPFLHGFWSLVGVTVLVSSLLGYATITLSSLTELLPEEARGTGLGLIRTSYLLIGAPSPVLVGAAADRGYFDEAFLVMAALVVLMLVLVQRIPRQ